MTCFPAFPEYLSVSNDQCRVPTIQLASPSTYADVHIDGGVSWPVVVADDVEGILQAGTLFVHDDLDDVECVPFGLFGVVRQVVLNDLFARAQ